MILFKKFKKIIYFRIVSLIISLLQKDLSFFVKKIQFSNKKNSFLLSSKYNNNDISLDQIYI